VIEDETTLRENITETLEFEGFRVIEAANGAAGVQLAQQQLPDLILCDILMPDLNGYDALRTLQQSPTTALIPFIFITAKADRQSARFGMELGADDYLIKPFTTDELLATIRARLIKRAAMAHVFKQRGGIRQEAGYPEREGARAEERCFGSCDFVGRRLHGYEIWERIGEGGASIVYKAYQPAIGRQVAIKVVRKKIFANSEFIRRFETEAALVARLEHPHIIPLYDYWHDHEGMYLVMRWLSGGSLRAALRQGGAWAAEPTARLLDQVADALAMAHEVGVIHRDLKPDNILLDEHGNAYLTDFGLAKYLVDAPASPPSEQTTDDLPALRRQRFDQGQGSTLYFTDPDQLIGTPAYLSPEQIRKEPLTRQSDIYSLGITLYEMLAGHHPFTGAAGEILIKHLREPVPPIHQQCPHLSPLIDAVIQKATAKDWRQRFADAPTMAAEFRRSLVTREQL
jgi:CheY-like chemotaxis protein/tRNA A-37 threonylcarbamoyl transferase component Bud32